jgi:retron-type reverse transcriptase
VYAIEGDIEAFFDNIDHKILLKKLYKIGIYDKRILCIIKQMLKSGYVYNGEEYSTQIGTMQGGILSPLLANVYLNDSDWLVGRMYLQPKSKYKSISRAK